MVQTSRLGRHFLWRLLPGAARRVAPRLHVPSGSWRACSTPTAMTAAPRELSSADSRPAAPDRAALGTTMLDAIGRALVRRDLGLARMALKRGIEGDVGDDDLVYGGLWVWLLERALHVTPDGSVERALRPGPHGFWTGRLCLWANGRVSGEELAASARETAQRVEAAFYAAMMKSTAGDPGAKDRLREVSISPVIDLMEVQLAREMVAPAFHPSRPPGVSVP